LSAWIEPTSAVSPETLTRQPKMSEAAPSFATSLPCCVQLLAEPTNAYAEP
jgi:hypothetical protein